MKTREARLLAFVLAVPLLASPGMSWGSEEEPPSPAPAGPTASILLGRIAAIEGAVYLVQEEGDEEVRVTVTSETITPGGFKVGDRVIASVLPDGTAVVLSALIEHGGTPPLHAETSAIERAEDR